MSNAAEAYGRADLAYHCMLHTADLDAFAAAMRDPGVAEEVFLFWIGDAKLHHSFLCGSPMQNKWIAKTREHLGYYERVLAHGTEVRSSVKERMYLAHQMLRARLDYALEPTPENGACAAHWFEAAQARGREENDAHPERYASG